MTRPYDHVKQSNLGRLLTAVPKRGAKEYAKTHGFDRTSDLERIKALGPRPSTPASDLTSRPTYTSVQPSDDGGQTPSFDAHSYIQGLMGRMQPAFARNNPPKTDTQAQLGVQA